VPPKVLVSRMIPEEGLAVLAARVEVDLNREHLPLGREGRVKRLAGKDGLISLLTDRIDAEVLEAAPTLRVVANVAVGYDNIDVAAASARGILVTNTPGVLTETTADLAWALILATARRLVEADRFLRAGKFREWGIGMMLGPDVHGKTLGLAGFGRIGRAVARRAKGFAMRIIYADEARAPEDIEEEAGARRVDKETLLGESDFLSLHLPLSEATRHYLGADELALMKPTAVLVNTSRGPVIDEAALAAALREKRIRAAGLDVYENEPAVHPGLIGLENCVLLPHIGSASEETRGLMARMAAENCLAALFRECPPNLVNAETFKGRRGK